eukprot:Hpha_TRINITY_DN15814_c0_g6::TRINITY_DN15814_c0_g6_i1::g.191682::m.191682
MYDTTFSCFTLSISDTSATSLSMSEESSVPCSLDFTLERSLLVLLVAFIASRGRVFSATSPLYSPLFETTLWLSTPIEKAPEKTDGKADKKAPKIDFPIPLALMPPPGIIEYLHSRRCEEVLDWANGWVARPVTGPGARRLIERCLEAPDQQKYSPEHDQEFQRILFSPTELLIPRGKGAARGPDIPLAVAKAVIQMKVGTEGLPSPQTIAHALDVQYLIHGGRTYLLALSGSKHVIADVKRKEVCEIFRLKDAFDDQPYWHLNAAMRNKQFGNERARLKINPIKEDRNDIVSGWYECEEDPPDTVEALDEPADLPAFAWSAPDKALAKRRWAQFRRGHGRWSIRSAGEIRNIDVDRTEFSVGTWVLPQVLPLAYYMDKSIATLRVLTHLELGFKVLPDPVLKNYRGLAGVTLDRRIYDIGRVVLWGQYSSSSKDRGVAASFAQAGGKAAVFTLEGKNCVCIAQWSRFAREHEWLYPPNTMFKVTHSLSEEHQQILDKSNLQLFSMSEVDDFDALEIFVRALVPRVTGDNAPEHVMQLFSAMQLIRDRRADAALAHLSDPSEPAVFTEEGRSVCKRLMRLGASEGILDLALLRAAEIGNDECVRILLGMNACPDAAVGEGRRALHAAAARGFYNVVRTLLEAGSSPTMVGGGFTPLEWAALRRSKEVVELLRPHTPFPVHPIPQNLENFKPKVRTLTDGNALEAVIRREGQEWTPEIRVGAAATVTLFVKKTGLFWLEFEDGTVNSYPDGSFTAWTADEKQELMQERKTTMGRVRHSIMISVRRSIVPQETPPDEDCDSESVPVVESSPVLPAANMERMALTPLKTGTPLQHQRQVSFLESEVGASPMNVAPLAMSSGDFGSGPRSKLGLSAAQVPVPTQQTLPTPIRVPSVTTITMRGLTSALRKLKQWRKLVPKKTPTTLPEGNLEYQRSPTSQDPDAGSSHATITPQDPAVGHPPGRTFSFPQSPSAVSPTTTSQGASPTKVGSSTGVSPTKVGSSTVVSPLKLVSPTTVSPTKAAGPMQPAPPPTPPPSELMMRERPPPRPLPITEVAAGPPEEPK